MMDKPKFYITYEDFGSGVKIYFLAPCEKDGKIFCVQPQPATWECKEQDAAAEIEPWLTIPRFHALPFLQAMADLCHKHGIRAQEEPILANELTAVKYHLEDMRKLLFAAVLDDTAKQSKNEERIFPPI
jgi:hypothetical protein